MQLQKDIIEFLLQMVIKYCPLDITNEDTIHSLISKENPDVVINTAAMTNVDLCEEEKELCDLINKQGSRIFS